MQIDINFVYTEGVRELAAALPATKNWLAPSGTTPTPGQGDLISFGESEDAPLFQVVSRVFIWKNPEHLVIQLLLGGMPPNEEGAHMPQL